MIHFVNSPHLQTSHFVYMTFINSGVNICLLVYLFLKKKENELMLFSDSYVVFHLLGR